MIRALLFIIAIATSEGACAARQPRPTADDLLARLARGEVEALIGRLGDDRSEFAADVYKKIETGDPKWLDVACQLRQSSDASVSLSLEFSVARALPRRPVDVLSLIGSCFAMEDLCTDPYIEDENRSASHVRRVERALSQPLPGALTSVAQGCLARIRRPANKPLQPDERRGRDEMIDTTVFAARG